MVGLLTMKLGIRNKSSSYRNYKFVNNNKQLKAIKTFFFLFFVLPYGELSNNEIWNTLVKRTCEGQSAGVVGHTYASNKSIYSRLFSLRQ